MSGLQTALQRFGQGARATDEVADQVGEIYVMLTWRCNLRCRMCPLWGDSGFCTETGPGPETLSVDRIVEFVRGAAAFRPRNVTFSGGEPLLSDLCVPSARRLRELGFKVAVTTNATLLSRLPEGDLETFDQINVSIDGPPLVLERVKRGGAATLDKAIAGLRKVMALRHGGKPALRLLTVITKHGVGHLVELLDLFESEGIGFDSYLFQHQMCLSQKSAVSHHGQLEVLLGPGVPYWEALVAEDGEVDVDVLLEEMRKIRARFPRAVFSPALDSKEVGRYYGDMSWLPPRLAEYCLSPWFDVQVAPSGDVWLCPGFPIGNLHDADFEQVFNGPAARRLRRTIAEGGVLDGCRACFYLYNYRR